MSLLLEQELRMEPTPDLSPAQELEALRNLIHTLGWRHAVGAMVDEALAVRAEWANRECVLERDRERRNSEVSKALGVLSVVQRVHDCIAENEERLQEGKQV
jgi:hypothetical protein